MIIVNKMKNLFRKESSRTCYTKIIIGDLQHYLLFGNVVLLETSKNRDRVKEQILQLLRTCQVTIAILKWKIVCLKIEQIWRRRRCVKFLELEIRTWIWSRKVEYFRIWQRNTIVEKRTKMTRHCSWCALLHWQGQMLCWASEYILLFYFCLISLLRSICSKRKTQF